MKFEHMKNIYVLLLAAGLFTASCGPSRSVQSPQYDSYEPAPQPAYVPEVSYQSFYDQLSPYGNWVNYPGYGYVWMPNAGPDFRPYATNGNWIYTDAGWTWASNYNWGWAPFHYGRWFYENGYGWMWVPGNEWAPAWVSWRGSNDYYGWAPLGPRISVDMALSNYNPPMNYWNFVPRRYMGNPGWHNYYVNESRNVTIINNTTIINNYSGSNRNRYAYAPGPDPNEVRRISGNNFTTVQIREANTPGERISGNQYAIYHPQVNTTSSARGNAGRPAAPAPARYESFSNVRPSTQYPANNQPVNNLQPANNPRPQNPQPAANPRPALQNNPGNNQPANAPQPSNGPRPQNPQPVSNPGPAVQNPQPVRNTAVPGNQKPNLQNSDDRPIQRNTIQRQPANSQMPNVQTPASRSSQQGATQQAPASNQTRTTGRPVTTRSPNTVNPVQRTGTPQNKPAEKPVEKPKTREANSQ